MFLGDDIPVGVHVDSVDSNGVSTPINLTLYEGYIVAIYYHATNTIAQQFSRHTQTGYLPIDPVDEVNGFVVVRLDKSFTTDAATGKLYGTIKTRFSDTNFTLNSRMTTSIASLDTVNPSVVKDAIPST